MADLIGEIDPIKVAEGRYLADEETIHYGLVPRTNRGIFAINELPDLTEKVQVGLFNLMEEKDVQIKGYKIRLPLDVVIVASANPEDYTSRGRIITPLKDRFDVQIRTHYPRDLEDEIAIMEQEVPTRDRGGRAVRVPGLPQGDHRAAHLRGARLARDQPGVRRERARDDQQLRERDRQRREARRARRRARDRAAPHRPARACSPRPPARSSSSTPARSRRRGDLVDRLINRAVLAVFDRVCTLDDLDARSSSTSRAAGASRSPTACRRRTTSRASAASPACARRSRALGPFESPGAHGGRDRAHPRRPAPAPEAQQDRDGGRWTYRALTAGRSTHASPSATPRGTARSGSGSTADQVFEKLGRVPVVHRRRAAGARLAAAPGRSTSTACASWGSTSFLEQLREADARALPRVQPRRRPRRDAPSGSTSCSTSSARRSTSAGRRTPTLRGQARRASIACRRACRRRSSSCATTTSRTSEARARVRAPARGAREHPRASRSSSAATASSFHGPAGARLRARRSS